MTVSPTSTLVKLTGLDMAHDYSIHLVMRTSAGDFHSNTITAKTHTLDNLTGIRVSFGQFSPGVEGEAEVERLIQIINRIGASYTEDLTTENTHLVCLVPRGPKYEKACEWNIPVVSADFLRACETHGKIQPVGQFYVAKER